MTRFRTLLALSTLTLLAACAKQSLPGAVEPAAEAGFLPGLWHGFIFPFAWFLSLIMPDVAIYAVPNNGGWYDFGYFLGICVFGVGANRGRKVVVREKVVKVRE